MQIKKQDTTAHYLELPKSRALTPNAGKDVEKQELSFHAGGNAWRCSRFREQFSGFLQN